MLVLGKGVKAFKALDIDTSKGKGVQVSIGGGGDPVGTTSIVTSFSVEQAENISVSQCLNGGVYLYAFGHDPQHSQYSLAVTSFLDVCSGKFGDNIAKALESYSKGRVSASKQLSTLTVGAGALHGYLIGQAMNVVDAQLGIVNTVYTFIALNPQGGGV